MYTSAVDRQTAATHEIGVRHAIISVQDPRNRQTYDGPATNKNTVGVLKLDFHDVNHDGMTRTIFYQPDGPIVPFNPEMADRILDFHQDMKEAGVLMILVHCDAGACRSPAICSALDMIDGRREDSIQWMKRKSPNSHVYTTIIERAVQRGLYDPSNRINPPDRRE